MDLISVEAPRRVSRALGDAGILVTSSWPALLARLPSNPATACVLYITAAG